MFQVRTRRKPAKKKRLAEKRVRHMGQVEEEEEEEVVVVATHHGIERESGTKSLAELHADGEKEEDRINLHERKQVNPLSTTLRRCYQCHFRLRAMRLRVARLSNLFW